MSDFPENFSLDYNPNALSEAERESVMAKLGFGTDFTDHMVIIDWYKDRGWQDARVAPYGPMPFYPASAVFHYGQEVFEGLKVYRHVNGDLYSFRPEENAKRLQLSARRLSLPELSVDYFVDSLKALVSVDGDWVPKEADSSLYIRPFMIANENFLGVRAAETVRYMVIASPVGPYFSGGVKPVSIWLSTDYNRAGKGGTGEAKCGGNYAASLLPQQIAADNGCQQVLFLDSVSNKYIDELGGMNFFAITKDNKIITPNINGNILHGVTRNSIITIAKDRGIAVEERPFSIDELKDGLGSGEIVEMFACGTAAVVVPISTIKSDDFVVQTAFGDKPGEITMSLRKELTDIQYGRSEDKYGWMLKLN